MTKEETILNRIGNVAALLQLAEECAELAMACFKKTRLLMGVNPPRKTMDEIDGAISEELTDVCLCADVLNLMIDGPMRQTKLDRWYNGTDDKGLYTPARWLPLDDMGAYQCSNCGFRIAIDGRPEDNDLCYCNRCGRPMGVS